ncbi:hypothetical protein HDU98_000805 [Podochytrium sp. JEL0797]|nr:hypothetical protein HDU98_000805 [Podochytrium sp. JEL0797]
MSDSGLHADTSEAKAGKKRAGRKPRTVDPTDLKQLKSLEAQRAFRQRRQDHVFGLEQKVAALQAIVDGRSAALPDAEAALLRQQLLAATAENAVLRQHGVAIDLRSSVPQSLGETTRCPGCSVEKLKTLLCMGQIKSMEGKQAEMLSEIQALRAMVSLQTSSATPANGSLQISSASTSKGGQVQPEDDLFWINLFNSTDTGAIANAPSPTNTPTTTPQTVMSSTELYGQPECEFAKIALRSIPSIQDMKEIDEIFDTFTIVSSCVDLNRIRKHMIRMMNCRTKLMDACAVMDRQKVIETLVLFAERNKKHLDHRLTFMKLAAIPDPTIDALLANFVETPESKRFRDSLHSIPAFQNPEAADIITRLCVLVWTPCPKGKEVEMFDLSIKTKKMLDSILRSTNSSLGDRTKMNMAMEIARISQSNFANLVNEMGGSSESEGEGGEDDHSEVGRYGYGSAVQTPLSHYMQEH